MRDAIDVFFQDPMSPLQPLPLSLVGDFPSNRARVPPERACNTLFSIVVSVQPLLFPINDQSVTRINGFFGV